MAARPAGLFLRLDGPLYTAVVATHVDVVGSLLRPTELLRAREDEAAGRLSRAAFKAIEDRAVDDAVACQEAAGLKVITDGELRRLSFQSQLTEAVAGFERADLDAFLWGDWHGDAALGNKSRERPAGIGIVAPLYRERSLCAEEFVYLRARTNRIPKITLPSPGLFVNFWSDAPTNPYATLDAFLSDVVAVLRAEVAELERLGARYIQLDAPHYPLLLQPATRAFYESRGWTLAQWMALGIELDNAVMEGFPGITFGFHLCRGNQASRWLVEGDYEPIARNLFQRINAQRLLLEYDDERAGSFEPLRCVPADKTVVLGLVTTKHAALESTETLVDRIHQAAQFVPLERLALSPQCGFSTSILGNNLTIAEQRHKLERVCEVAARVWGY